MWLTAFVMLVAVAFLGGWFRARQRRLRWMAQLDAAVTTGATDDGTTEAPGRVRSWLAGAGFGGERAVRRFVEATAVSGVVGLLLGWATAGLAARLAISVAYTPGGLGEIMAGLMAMLPYVIALVVAMAPTLYVRAARRRRLAAIERDLPLVLELLATLAEAGLGLDAAMARVLDGQDPDRPASLELRTFQRDVSAGVPRVQALRQLAARADVSALSVFVAAVIQAEQVGASLAETLRHQADDLRNRRRERALLHAQAMPVKLVLPLVVCFLPGIFLSTLGPVLYQMIRVADTVLRTGGR